LAVVDRVRAQPGRGARPASRLRRGAHRGERGQRGADPVRLSRLILIGVLSLLALGAAQSVASAATITVAGGAADSADSSTDGNASCSLREAVIAANQDSTTTPQDVSDCNAFTTGSFGADTINVGVGAAGLTISGTGEDAALNGDLDVTDGDGLTINGNGTGGTIVSQSTAGERIFDASQPLALNTL